MNKLLFLTPALLLLAPRAHAQEPVKPNVPAPPKAATAPAPLPDPQALVKPASAATSATLPPRHPIFARNRALADSISDARFQEVETNGKLAEAFGVPSYLSAKMDSSYQLGVSEVRLRWGVQQNYDASKPLPKLDSEHAFQMNLPGYYSVEQQAVERELLVTPADKVLLARRAAAYPFTYGVLNLPGDAYQPKLEGDQMARIITSWSAVENLIKEPVPDAAVSPILKALEIVKYAPTRGSSPTEKRNIEYQLKNLKTAMAALEPTFPDAVMLARMVDAKSVLTALYAAPTDARRKAEAAMFVRSAGAFAAQTPHHQPISLLTLAIINALEPMTPAELAARAAPFKDADYAFNCAHISLFLDEIGQLSAAKPWAQMASATGSDDPFVLLAQSKTLPYMSRERFDLLQKCAFALDWTNRYKPGALEDLVAHADKFGDLELQRGAREELLMSRGAPYDWDRYAQFEWETGEWGNAYNANRLIVGWQRETFESPRASQLLPDTPTKLDALDGDLSAARISPKVDARLKGAFLMLKLGRVKASQAETKEAIRNSWPAGERTGKLTTEQVKTLAGGKTIGADFAATFVLHRRFLRAQLAKSPNDANLKAALDRLVALQIMGTKAEPEFTAPTV